MNPRAVVAGTLIALVAWISLSTARWLQRGATLDPTSDLDAPRLFARGDFTYEELARASPEGVPVLCYHYFREGITVGRVIRVLGAVLLSMPTLPDKEYWSTPMPEFERQMRWLHEEGYRTLTLDELTDWLDGRAGRPERAVVITIDDGDESFARLAAPVLRRYGFHATVFVLTGRVGEQDWNDVDFTDWSTLRRLQREGTIQVESHTHDMHTKVRVKGESVPRFLLEARADGGEISLDSALARDLAASRAAIRRELGRDCRYLAWPFGFGDAPVDSLARAVGFRRILTLSPHRNVRDFREAFAPDSPDEIGRYAITARTSFRLFRLMVQGGRSA